MANVLVFGGKTMAWDPGALSPSLPFRQTSRFPTVSQPDDLKVLGN